MEGKKPQFSFGTDGEQDREPTARILRLELEDTARKAPSKASYNPYDREVVLGQPKKAAPARPDLRKLSEWIKLKKEVDSLKAADPPPAPKPSRPRR